MYPEKSHIDGIDSLVVAVDDGTVFHVSPAYIGGPSSPYPEHVRLRWVIRRVSAPPHGDESPTEYVGPPIQPDRSPDAVRVLVSDWWKMKASLGQT